MEKNYSVTASNENYDYKPWSDEPERIISSLDFETFKEALHWFNKMREPWETSKAIIGYETKVWEKGETLYFAAVRNGHVLVQIELYPIPEDWTDELPW